MSGSGGYNIMSQPLSGYGINKSLPDGVTIDDTTIGLSVPKPGEFSTLLITSGAAGLGVNAITIPAVGSLVVGDTGATNTSSTSLTAAGYQALNANTTGNFNTAFGNQALSLNTTGNVNAAFGASALKISTGSNNAAFGVSAGILATTGSNNTFLGQTSGGQVTTGSHNTCVGYNAGGITTASGCIIIGYNVSASSATTDNQINIGNVYKGDAGTFAANLPSTLTMTADNIIIGVAAKGLVLKQGANGKCGTFICNGVTPVTVGNTSVAITDAVIISLNTVGGSVGALPHLATITAGTGFTVVGTASDSSTYNYSIISNAA